MQKNSKSPDTKETLPNVQTAKDMSTPKTTATSTQDASNAPEIT
jgi:hypothetical protein